jgi:hypothetical protein
MESNVKRRTLEKLFQENAGQDIITSAHQMESEADRLKSKQALQAKKAETMAIRRQIEVVAKELDDCMVSLAVEPLRTFLMPAQTALHRQLTPALEEARDLTRSIQDMELELAMLRNSRPEEERMTIEEANQYLEDQVCCWLG